MKINDSGARLNPSQAASQGEDRPARRILVIEDETHVRDAITLSVRAANFKAVAVENGAAGLKEFQVSHFDLAIVDIFMLGMDGLAVIKALRSRRPALPVIAISGVRLDSSGRTAFDLPGVAELSNIICLKKPFQTDQLIQAIRAVMSIGQP
jgi:CheY-like chemotaxis protein